MSWDGIRTVLFLWTIPGIFAALMFRQALIAVECAAILCP